MIRRKARESRSVHTVNREASQYKRKTTMALNPLSMKYLLSEIERVLPDGGEWCVLEKATTLAALIVGLRPALVVEIGVFSGGSLIPMLLALKHVGRGRAIAIDPWAASASVVGMSGANEAWWSTVDHDAILRKFIGRMEVLDVGRLCDVWRKPSDDCDPPAAIDLLHVDGNHSDQAIRDVERYAPNVPIGGMLILDDLNWEGAGVLGAHALALRLGFVDLYPLDLGIVMQRRAAAS